MLNDTDLVYHRTPLNRYSIRQRIAIRIADLGFYLLIGMIGRTVRFETVGSEYLESINAAGKLPIYAVWHDRIFLGTYYLRRRGIVFLASQSFDGEYIARFLQRFGFGVIRGSSTRGGAKGLVQMIRKMKQGLTMGFTLDGPKGPRYVAKSGAVHLARKTGNPILPFIVQAKDFWRLGSWDGMQVPRPFTHSRVIYGKPIYVPAYPTDKELNAKQAELQRAMDDLVVLGESWRKNDEE